MSRRILVFVAEDNVADLFLIRESLLHHALEFDLMHAQDGEIALRLLKQAGSDFPCPDIVLLDLNLPKRGGDEVLAALRENEICAEVPIIVVSSADSPRERARAAQLEVARYFRKPSDYDQFMELGGIVKDVLFKTGAGGGVSEAN